jgi:hypothetical protein
VARSPIDDVASAAKDAAYVSVGLGVIAIQRLQVRRHELSKALSGHTGLVGDRLKAIEERLEAALVHR